ncbi:hypothetical protein AB1N83_007066 [Pleurotus pulmonarius]
MMYPWRRLGHSHDRSAASAIQLALRPPAAQNDCSAGNDTSMKECFHVTCVDVDCFTPLAHRPRQAQAGLDNVHGSSEPYPGVFGSVSKLGAVNFYSNARTLVPSLAPKMLGITRLILYTSTNMKFFSAAVLSLFAVVVAAQEPLDFGGQCGTFVGTFPCKAGLKCCYVNPDDGKCTAAYRVLHTFQ